MSVRSQTSALLAATLVTAFFADQVLAGPGEPGLAEPLISLAAPSETALLEVEDAATPAATNYSDDDLECMAKVVHRESRGQPRDGQLAVAHVMINRVRSERFPASICKVAYQPFQFSGISGHQPNRESAAWATSVEIAHEVLSGRAQDTSNGALYFHATRINPNRFFRTRKQVAALEDHIFYR